MQASQPNVFAVFKVPVEQATQFMVSLGIVTNSNAGQFQLSSSSSASGPFTNMGPVLEGYSATPTATFFNDLGTFTLTGSVPAFWYFKITVTGKSASSTGYWVYLDNLQILLTD